MSTAAKNQRRSKSKEVEFDAAFDGAMEKAMKAEPKDVKVHITCRLDSDIYLELKRRAESGDGNGKYQSLMNDILREALFKSRNVEEAYNFVLHLKTETEAFLATSPRRKQAMHEIAHRRSTRKAAGRK